MREGESIMPGLWRFTPSVSEDATGLLARHHVSRRSGFHIWWFGVFGGKFSDYFKFDERIDLAGSDLTNSDILAQGCAITL
ncbi:MAG: hypothetical protein ACI87E_004904 [Mariniblastus sp.]|jgi:hypothetical protein